MCVSEEFQVAAVSRLHHHERMKILIAGSSGLIGTALIAHLTSNGHDVHTLVRRAARNGSEVQWNPATGHLDASAVDGYDAVINLAGAGVGDKRWTSAYKQEILQSRVLTTSAIANAIAASTRRPSVLINGSAIGYYGDRGADDIDETSSAANDFLADVVKQWEAAAAPATAAGVRVVFARTGLVVSSRGGAFGKLLPLFKLGLGGVIGSGRQYWPLISMTDEVRALEFLLTHEIAGPVNLTAPQVPTNREVTKSLAAALHRPALLPVPGFALHIVLGEFASGITGGAKVLPRALEAAGFEWKHPNVDAIIRGEVVGTR